MIVCVYVYMRLKPLIHRSLLCAVTKYGACRLLFSVYKRFSRNKQGKVNRLCSQICRYTCSICKQTRAHIVLVAPICWLSPIRIYLPHVFCANWRSNSGFVDTQVSTNDKSYIYMDNIPFINAYMQTVYRVFVLMQCKYNIDNALICV